MTQLTSAPPSSHTRWLFPLGLLVATLVIYVSTLAPGMVKGDGGEFQLALATLGVPHATGYPLYTLIGWLWIKAVPVGSVAWRLNLFSAVCGTLTVGLVYAIVHKLTQRTIPALAAACFLAFSPTFWSLSSVTEVYTLNALSVVSLFYLLLAWRDSRQHRFAFLVWIAFLFGLGLSHHRTIALLLPAILLFLILEEAPVHFPRRTPKAVGELASRGFALVGAFLAGLLPYLHVFIHELKLGVTVREVIANTILGGDYAFFLGLRSDPLQVLWGWPRHEMGIVGLILAAVGLSWLFWKSWRVAVLLACSYVCVVGFCLFYRVPDLPDFMVPATIILAIWAGTSTGYLFSQDPKPAGSQLARLRLPRPWVRWALEGVLILLALSSLRNFKPVRASVQERTGDVEGRARALLAYSFEPGATVVTDWELATAGQYLVQVEKKTSNARFVPMKLTNPEACSRFFQTLDAGGAVYLVPPVVISRMPGGYRLSSESPFVKITKQALPYTRLSRAVNAQLELQGVRRDGRQLVLRWIVTGSPLTKNYTTYVHFFDADGQAIGQQDKGMGAEVTCWYPSTAWPARQAVQDFFTIPLETVRIRLGLYEWNEGQIEQFGAPILVQLEP